VWSFGGKQNKQEFTKMCLKKVTGPAGEP